MRQQVYEMARRSVLQTLRQPALIIPPIVFPLIMMAINTGGLDAAIRKVALKSGGKPRRSAALPSASAAPPEQKSRPLSETLVILPRGARERLREREIR